MIERIAELLQHDTAGDPMTGLKWSRRTTAKIAAELCEIGIQVSDRTVAALLHRMGYSLRVNHKKVAGASPGHRNEQFLRITELRKSCAAASSPIISVDAKKKELVGRFKNDGTTWEREPVAVNDHDFRSDAQGIAIPYGVYDLLANHGVVFIGDTHNTPAFSVDAIARWWRIEGRLRYPGADSLVILADSGGSNAASSRAWKYGLQTKLCNRHGISVRVAHYPSGASKWNPIEHRLFSEISKNWAGRPLDSYETILNYISTTSTKTGLTVEAHRVFLSYETGVKITDVQMRELNIVSDPDLPKLNYTIHPA